MSFPTKRVGDGKDARFAVPTYNIDPETGAYVPPSGGGGGSGTEYTEDAAAPSNPAAPGRSLRRRDAPSAETSADGDWVTQNGTNKGEAYVKDLDVAVALEGMADVVGGIDDTAYSGTDASIAAMIRAIADAAISQAAAATKEDPSATWFDPDVTNALQLITASPAVLTGYMTSNPHATDLAALLFFDAASTAAVTLGTTPPDWAVCLHGADGADVPKNILFSNGIVVAAIKNFTGSTAPTTALPTSVSYRAP